MIGARLQVRREVLGFSPANPTGMNGIGPSLLALAVILTAATLNLPQAAGLHAPRGLHIEIIAKIPAGARELAFLPGGDLVAGTDGDAVYVVPNADGAGLPGSARQFARFDDEPAAGVALGSEVLYVGTQFAVYRVGYGRSGGVPSLIARVRSRADRGDDNHRTTSVALSKGVLYASSGSTCDACTETNPLRATIQQMNPDGSNMRAKAVRFRNAIALAVNPATGSLWAGGAGQDALPQGHPYEFIDNVSAHSGVADYGWPACEENRHAYRAGADCAKAVEPRVSFPAYATLIGAAFYPSKPHGMYALPARYAGGLFVTLHGSWHTKNGCTVAPLVAFVPMNGDEPVISANWGNPSAQWSPFITGFQPGCSAGSRIGRPTGVAVGPQGDLFVGDDLTGYIYRIRP